MDLEAVAQGRAVLVTKLNEPDMSIEARPILGYNERRSVVKVGKVTRYRLKLPLAKIRPIVFQSDGSSKYAVCYLVSDSDPRVEKAETHRLLAIIIEPEIWSANDQSEGERKVFILRRWRGQEIRAAQIIQENGDDDIGDEITVGVPQTYPTKVDYSQFAQLADPSQFWFIGTVVFGVIVDVKAHPKGRLHRR